MCLSSGVELITRNLSAEPRRAWLWEQLHQREPEYARALEGARDSLVQELERDREPRQRRALLPG